MRRWLAVVVCVLAGLLQVAVTKWFPFAQAAPVHFGLLVVVLLSLETDWAAGFLVGAGVGFLLDVLGSARLGSTALAMGAVGGLISLVQENVFKERFLTRLMVVFVASLILNSVEYHLLTTLGVPLQYGAAFRRVILPSALSTTAVAPIFFLLVRRLIHARAKT